MNEKDLLAIQKTGAEEERARAFDHFEPDNEKKALRLLELGLRDSSPLVRERAAAAATRLGASALVPKIAGALKQAGGHARLVRALVVALKDLAPDRAHEYLVEALGLEDPVVVDAVTRALGERGFDALPTLLTQLAGADERRRNNAAVAISRCVVDPTEPVLARLARLKPDELARALEALASARGPVTAKILLTLLAKAKEVVKSKKNAARLVTRVKHLLRGMGPAAVKDVLYCHQEARGAEEFDPVKLVVDLFGEDALEPLMDEYAFVEEEGRTMVESVALEFPQKAAETLLERTLNLDQQRDAELVEGFKRLLGKIAFSAPRALLPLLEHRDPRVRFEVAQTLERSGTRDPDAVAILIRHLMDEDPSTREAVARVLAVYDESLAGKTAEQIYQRLVGRHEK
ncbi:MAG: hypothetical protein Kow0069_19730 [Promethearchaeota archaeon]